MSARAESKRATANTVALCLSDSARSQVASSQHLSMMELVTSDYVGERSHGDFGVVRQTSPCPGVVLEMTEEIQRRPTNCFQFRGKLSQRIRVERRVAHVVILLVTRHRCLVGSCKAKRAICEDFLGVDHVPNHLVYAPL